jgi:hypothetical protein
LRPRVDPTGPPSRGPFHEVLWKALPLLAVFLIFLPALKRRVLRGLKLAVSWHKKLGNLKVDVKARYEQRDDK